MARRFIDQLMYGPDEPENAGDQTRAPSRTSSARRTFLWGDSQDIPPMKTPRGQAWRQQVLQGSQEPQGENPSNGRSLGHTLLYGDAPSQPEHEPRKKKSGGLLSTAAAVATMFGDAAGEHERVLEQTRKLKEEREEKQRITAALTEARERARTPEGRAEAEQALAMIATISPSALFDHPRIQNLRAYVMGMPSEERAAAAIAQFERIEQENQRKREELAQREEAEKELARYEANPLDTAEWAANYNQLSETYAGEIPEVPENRAAYIRQQVGHGVKAMVARFVFGNITSFDPNTPTDDQTGRRRRRYEPDDQIIVTPEGLEIRNMSGGADRPDIKFYPWDSIDEQLEFGVEGIPWLKPIDRIRARMNRPPLLSDNLGQLVVTTHGREQKVELARVPLPKPALFFREITAAKNAASSIKGDPEMPLEGLTPRDFIQMPEDTRAGQAEILKRQQQTLERIAQALQGLASPENRRESRAASDTVEVPLATVAAMYRKMQQMEQQLRRSGEQTGSQTDDDVIDGDLI